jgi:hypothetical protein
VLHGGARIPVTHSHLYSELLSSSASRMPNWHAMLSRVSAEPGSTGSISPLGNMDWSSDVGGSADASTSSQSPPSLSTYCRSAAVTDAAGACLL